MKFKQINVTEDDAIRVKDRAKEHGRPMWAITKDALDLYDKVFEKGRQPAPEGKFPKRGRKPEPKEPPLSEGVKSEGEI